MAGGTASCGSWACSEGGWNSPTPRGSTEFFFVFSGRGSVTDPDGTPHPFGPGDTVVLPTGWYGRWDVDEFIHKVWLVKEHDDVPGASLRPVVVPLGALAGGNVAAEAAAQKGTTVYDVAGRRTLNSVDPRSWKATGFKPSPLNINPGFKKGLSSHSIPAATTRGPSPWGRGRALRAPSPSPRAPPRSACTW
jgi:hypothetical protein